MAVVAWPEILGPTMPMAALKTAMVLAKISLPRQGLSTWSRRFMVFLKSLGFSTSRPPPWGPPPPWGRRLLLSERR